MQNIYKMFIGIGKVMQTQHISVCYDMFVSYFKGIVATVYNKYDLCAYVQCQTVAVVL